MSCLQQLETQGAGAANPSLGAGEYEMISQLNSEQEKIKANYSFLHLSVLSGTPGLADPQGGQFTFPEPTDSELISSGNTLTDPSRYNV